MGESVPIYLRVPRSVYEKLVELKEKKGRLNVQEVIREAISEYLEKEGMKEVVLDGTSSCS